ncbi:MAG: hypothetical protein AAF497_28045, partial [Planctomycetota bacterium]
MHDDYSQAIDRANSVLQDPRKAMTAKTTDMNRQLNEEIPWFRCSDKTFEEIYYYLWSLYLMYYIEVNQGFEQEHHTQTAVNNFLGMHRYDATFQIPVGAWTGNPAHYAYGNVLTWKHLFANGHYRKMPGGAIQLADNKGTTWHSGVYGAELSEHVLGAWKIYQHTGDVEFLHACYEGYFREAFREQIVSFFSNHFEVAESLIAMARITGHEEDVETYQRLVPSSAQAINHWFDQRWQVHGHTNYFAGPKNGMLMTTGFWHLRSKYFPRDRAKTMIQHWALDREKGFYGDFFPLAMSRQSMKTFASPSDQSFGYTPDTAYFMLSGMFRQRMGDSAWRLTLNHLRQYNFHDQWQIPVAPEAYTRRGRLFGDQYSNFNAGKILLYLEGLAGLEYSAAEDQFLVHDTMPTEWEWMELRVPIRVAGEQRSRWPRVRYERALQGELIQKSIHVSDCPFRVTIEPWCEGRSIEEAIEEAIVSPDRGTSRLRSEFDEYVRFRFDPRGTSASVTVSLRSTKPTIERE